MQTGLGKKRAAFQGLMIIRAHVAASVWAPRKSFGRTSPLVSSTMRSIVFQSGRFLSRVILLTVATDLPMVAANWLSEMLFSERYVSSLMFLPYTERKAAATKIVHLIFWMKLRVLQKRC